MYPHTGHVFSFASKVRKFRFFSPPFTPSPVLVTYSKWLGALVFLIFLWGFLKNPIKNTLSPHLSSEVRNESKELNGDRSKVEEYSACLCAEHFLLIPALKRLSHPAA